MLMKKTILFLAALLISAFLNGVYAQVFSHQTSSGHTLYYRVIDQDNLKAAVIGYPTNNAPQGNLTIDATVPNDGITYTVTRIDTMAFLGCTGLTSVSMPPTIKQIGYGSFYNCTGLIGTLNIPNGVTSILPFAYAGCTSISSVVLSNTVQGVGYAAFDDCTGVTSVTLGTGLKSMGDWNFGYCTNLHTVNIFSDSCETFFDTSASSIAPAFFRSGVKTINIGGNVKHIPMYAFYDCDSLTNIIMPSSVKHIGRWSFAYCDGLENVIIESINSIGYACFDSCFSLRRVEIGSVKNMGRWCFAECPQLRHVEIGDSIQTISSCCFIYDNNLRYVSLGSSVILIERYAFDDCMSLDTIVSHAMIAPQLEQDVFSEVSSNAHIMIPCGSTMYQSRWSHFNYFTEMNPLVFTAVPDNPAKGVVSIMTMPTCTSSSAVVYAQANSGYHFDHWSDGSTDNPYFLTVTENTALVAYFVSDAYILRAISVDENKGTAQVLSHPTPTNPQGTVVAMPNDGYVFDHWSDGNTSNPYTLTLTQDTTLYAYFVEQTVSAYNLTLVSSDPNKGTVQKIKEPTVEDPQAIVVAIPNEGFRFDHWSNGVTTNPYSLTLTSDTILIAYFASTQGIGDINDGSYTVATHEKQIQVEISESLPVEVFDIQGRKIFSSNNPVTLAVVNVPVAGIYMIRIGQRMEKVVVL